MEKESFLKNKRILYVVNSPSHFLAHRLPVALAAQQSGVHVHVASVNDNKDSRKIQDLGFTFHQVPFSRHGMNPFKEAKTIISLYRLYRKLRADIVHQITIKPMIYGSFAARLTRQHHVVNSVAGLGYVFVKQGGLKHLFLNRFVIFLFKLSFRLPSLKVGFENPDDMEDFVKLKIISKKDAIVIKGVGIDLNQFKPNGNRQDNKTPIVMLASRLLWAKGVKEFVEAASALQREGIQARFVLVGSNDPTNPSSIPTAQLQEWSKSKIVEVWGFQEDIPKILLAASIVCLPSYREGCPRVLIEAAALCRPIITTNEPGCRLICRDGYNGMLVESRNSQALSLAIKTLLQNPKLCQEMGRQGREMVEREFSQDLVVSQTLLIYKSLLVSSKIAQE